MPLRSELWTLGVDGPRLLATSGLELRCADPPIDHADTRFTCLAFDGRRTLLWSVDARTAELAAVASLPGRVYALQPAPDGTLLGWAEEGLVQHRSRPPRGAPDPASGRRRAADRAGRPWAIRSARSRPPRSGAVVTVYHLGH